MRVVLVSAPLRDRNEEERWSASLTAARVAAQVCAKSKGLEEQSRRDLSLEPVVDIQVQILLEGFQRGDWPRHSESVIYSHICSLLHLC